MRLVRGPVLAGSCFLFLLNLWICARLLTTEHLVHMGSIEGTHIALSRYVQAHWDDLSWFPLWYGGIPYQNTYAPLLHLLVAAVSAVTGLTPAHAYHAVTAVFYSLGPVTLFWLAFRLSRSITGSLLAGLLYSVLSPSAWLMRSVGTDLGSVWLARRLQALVLFGEGPHVASMTLLPVAVLLLMVAFEKRRPLWWLGAALGLASVVLANWLGGAALAMAVCAWLLARREEAVWRDWPVALALGIYCYALVCTWIPPFTLVAIRSAETRGPFAALAEHWRYVLAVALAFIVLVWLTRRLAWRADLRFAALFLFLTAAVTLSAEWAGVYLLPQPQRYHLEMEMALLLMAGLIAGRLVERHRPLVRTAVLGAALLLCIYPALRYRYYGRQLIRAGDVTSTIEYRLARWLEANLGGRRVLVTGSVRFYLNAFTEVPQFGGGFDQGLINPIYWHVSHQILSGENAGREEGEVAVQWMRALGIDAVVVNGPRSQEVYKDFRNPQKFEGQLPVVWRQGDDTIYLVPRRSASLAHVIRRDDLPSRRPANGLDLEPVRPYMNALENAAFPLAEMKWRSKHSAVVNATLARDHILSVQISYHPGWKATVQDRARPAYGDALGQLVLEPECEGPCTVELDYDGAWQIWLARLLCAAAWLGSLAWVAVGLWGRKSHPI